MSLHRGQIGHINIYALVTWSILDPIVTSSLEHNCQYALFDPDVMCHYFVALISKGLITVAP